MYCKEVKTSATHYISYYINIVNADIFASSSLQSTCSFKPLINLSNEWLPLLSIISVFNIYVKYTKPANNKNL